MRKLGLKAIQVQHGFRNTFVQTINPRTKKKSLLSFGVKFSGAAHDGNYPDKENFNNLVKDFFTDYEQYFELESLYGMKEYGDSRCYNVITTVKSKVKDDQLIPLKIEIQPQETDTNNEVVEELQM